MGFATKNNFAISLVLSEMIAMHCGSQLSAEQYKHHNIHNRVVNMIDQGLLGAQKGRYAPWGIGRDKGKMCWGIMLICILIGLNIKCRKNHAKCGLVRTLNEINFGIYKQNLPNRISETRVFYICTNMYPINRMRDKLGIMYT